MIKKPPTGNHGKQLPDAQWWTIALLLVSAVITASALALIYVPGWIVESTFSEYREQGQTIQQTALVNATSSARQTVTLAIGGIIAIVTFVLSLAKHRVTKQEHALEKAKNDREQEKHAQDRDTLWSNRYSEALTQFGNETSESIRLGGIYSLERIAKESANDRQPILEVLCAYLRDNCRANLDHSNEVVIQRDETTKTVREVMARIVKMSPPSRLDLTKVDLTNVSFSEATLKNADLKGADLSDAKLLGTNLSGANLLGAALGGANLREANLKNANISAANLVHADMHLTDCTGITAYETKIGFTDLRAADFKNANLERIRITNSDLSSASFAQSNLAHSTIEKTNLTNTDFSLTKFDKDTSFISSYVHVEGDPKSIRPILLSDFSAFLTTSPPRIVP